jgi:hypothetical protein
MFTNRCRAARAKRKIIFARSAFVTMPFDRQDDIRVLAEPSRLARKYIAIGLIECGTVVIEENAVSHILLEIPNAARNYSVHCSRCRRWRRRRRLLSAARIRTALRVAHLALGITLDISFNSIPRLPKLAKRLV